MICRQCRTELPDEAIACWKCGVATTARPEQAPRENRRVDPLLAVLALVISAAVFICAGWAVPFTVWGLVTTWSNQNPQWSGVMNIVSGGAFILSAVGMFGGSCWGIYVLLDRLTGGAAKQ